MEQNMIEMIRQKNRSDKRLLTMEVVIGLTSTLFLFAMLAVGIIFMKLEKPVFAFILPVSVGLVQFFICAFFALRIEQVAGYYECRKCGHRYVPSYKAVSLAMHMGRSRYMKCPKCGKTSWQKKVIGEIEQEN